ncbi:MAG TPA: hypothetical protein VFK86_16455 [Bauldia sp.]|nr:hypothetical protein [Bauldia sp.]
MTAVPSPAAPPGRIWYLVAIVVFVAGMAGMAAFLLTRLMDMGAGLTRFVVPGEQTLVLEPGGYTIFHETQSVIDGKIYASSGLGGLTVSVTGPDGEPVPLGASSGRYSFGGHAGFAVFDFTAGAAGPYVIAGRYADGAGGPETVLAVGAGFLSSLLTTIFGSLGIAFAGAIIAAVIAVRVLVKRRRAGLRF